jgi:hypothetical protein
MSGEGNQDDEGVDTCASPRLYLKGTTPVSDVLGVFNPLKSESSFLPVD